MRLADNERSEDWSVSRIIPRAKLSGTVLRNLLSKPVL